MSLKWDPIYSVNVKEIDEQHKKMFDILNRLHEIVREGGDREEIKEIMKELKEYGSYHLGTEEKYFAEFNYPDKEFHIKQHDFYREKIMKIRKEVRESDFSEKSMKELLDFLRKWWLEHIQNIDQQYSVFFNSKGLQ